MVLVSLIGEKLAIEGEEFLYLGPQSECRNCRLKTVCFNLKPKRRYKITKIREKQHHCNLHDGCVVVVEVEELPITTAINRKPSKGEKTKITPQTCQNIGCEHYELCTNIALQRDKIYTVTKVEDKLSCPAGHTLYKIQLKD
jgi:uncharacterized protein (UPF0179 family)